MSKVDLGIDSSLARRVEKVGNEWKWIPILLHNFVESLIVDAKAKRTILFLDNITICLSSWVFLMFLHCFPIL